MPHIKPVISATGFSHMWGSFCRKYHICHWQVLSRIFTLVKSFSVKISTLHLPIPRICLTIVRSYQTCQSQLGLKMSWYYPGLIRILKILSSCHDILLLWILATSRTTDKTKQTIMDFAGKMWHCKISVFYTPPSLLPPLYYDPRMSLTLFQDIGDNFPPEGVLDNLCL